MGIQLYLMLLNKYPKNTKHRAPTLMTSIKSINFKPHTNI